MNLGIEAPFTRGFLDDPRVEGYDTDAAALAVSESKLEEIATLAERVGAAISTPDRLATFAPCAADADAAACARGFIAGFAARVWGRPAQAEEAAALVDLFARGAADGGHAGGVALAAEAMLLSPHFVYRTELGAAGATGPSVTLTGDEIASALSFLTTGARPDPELLEAGLGGALVAPERRVAEAARLLATPAGRRQLARFVRAWLGLDDVAFLNKDVGVFPSFSPRVRQALDRELATLLDHVFSTGGGFRELVLAEYTFPGPALAAIYGAGDLRGPIGDFTRVDLDPTRRRGLLGSPAFLARHALVNQTNPVERGLYVRNRVFCQDVGAPPPDVVSEPPTGPAGTTTRSKYEAHQREPRCRACHALIDPIGFGLEAFDAIGRFRTHEGAHPVDARGELVGTDVDGAFTGPAQLAERIANSAQAQRCFVAQFWRFVHGRALGGDDSAEIDHLTWRFAGSGHSVAALVGALVERPNFITRLGATP